MKHPDWKLSAHTVRLSECSLTRLHLKQPENFHGLLAAFSTSLCFYSNTSRNAARGGTWHYNFPLSPTALEGREKLPREPSVWFKQE